MYEDHDFDADRQEYEEEIGYPYGDEEYLDDAYDRKREAEAIYQDQVIENMRDEVQEESFDERD